MSYFNYDGVTRAQAKAQAKATTPKSGKKSGKKGRKTEGPRRKGKQTFATYIFKVLKSMKNGNDKFGMSKKGMAVMNSVVTDVFERLMKEASDAAKYAKKATVGHKEVIAAAKFTLPGKLSELAIKNGNDAVKKFEQVSKDGAKVKTPKKKSVSRSSKAGLVFPVGRVARHMKKARVASRVGAAAPVFVAAVLEYVTREVLEKGSDELAFGKKRITPRVVNLGIMSDSELKQVFSKVTIAAGGVQPDNIHVSLLGKKAQKAAAAADDGGYYY
jgi:histone H2A